MDAAALDKEIDAYQSLLPSIRSDHGSVWALIVHEKLVKTFSDFSQAARYATAHHRNEQVLIRHTDERIETAPFVEISR